MAEHTTSQIFPSLEAFKRAKGTLAGAAPVGDPLEKFYEAFGLWFTGQIRDLKPLPLPVIVEIKEKPRAKEAAKKGWRPLADGEAELQDMLKAFFAQKDDKGKPVHEVPPGLVAFLAPAPAPVAAAPAPAAAPAKGESKTAAK